MVENPWVWIAAFVLIAVVAGFALWRGRGSSVSVGISGIKLHTPEPEATDKLSVAERARIEGDVGKIQGRIIEDTQSGVRASETNVGRDMRVKGKVGEITGERISSTQTRDNRTGKSKP